MHHPHHPFLLFMALLVALCSFAPLGTPAPALAQFGPPLVAGPAALAASVPLGEQRQLSVNLSASAGAASPQALMLYEALAAQAAQRVSKPGAPLQVPLPVQSTRVDPRIRVQLQAASHARTEFLVFLGEQANLSAAAALPGWDARGQAVHAALQATAERSQGVLRALLDARGVPYRAFWIVNALAVRGTAADLAVLEARPEIALLQAVEPVALPPDEAVPSPQAFVGIPSCSPDLPDNNAPACWALRRIGADRAWRDFGVRGQGIVVGSIDTGANYTHQALLRQYRGYVADGSVDHSYSWFDPQQRLFVPGDDNGHGTHTIGSIVGAGGTLDAPSIGVAPGARWIAAQGCERDTCSPADLIAAAQWMLAPTDLDGLNPRPDLRPHIVNNSWAGKGGDPWFTGYVAAWRAAGIFPVFAAGNYGPGCASIASPADNPDVLAVGSTSLSDAISGFSARGARDGVHIKPDITAPGDGILSAYRGGDAVYNVLRGTSMAAPHAAGAVALLWSANPTLIGNYDATYALITGSALPMRDDSCGPQADAPNNAFGYGRLDVAGAVARARVDVAWLSLPAGPIALDESGAATVAITLDAARVPGPGSYAARVLVSAGDLSTDPLVIEVRLDVVSAASQGVIEGSVRDAASGAPLRARVFVADGPSVSVDATGAYSLTLPRRDAPYTLTAAASGYISATAAVSLDQIDMRGAQAFTLTADLPRIAVSDVPLTTTLEYGQSATLLTTVRNAGTRPLSYSVSVAPDPFGIWSSENVGGPTYSWITPTASTALVLSDDGASDAIALGFTLPFYGRSYERIYVYANGRIGFSPPAGTSLSGGCLPVANTAVPLLLPFSADLDPSQGGQIFAEQTAQGFVVTFEGVPLHADQPALDAPTYSFQVLLTPSGRIGFVYKQLGPLPRTLVVGIQKSSVEFLTIGCGRRVPLNAGLALELRPQPAPRLWFTTGVQGVEIAAGESAPLAVQLNWVRPQWGNAMLRGTLELVTNDPTQPQLRLPVSLTSRPAPHEVILPLAAK